MAQVETLQAILERRLIGQLARELDDAASPPHAERLHRALRDLVLHTDPSLDHRLFDLVTESRLRRRGLWPWADADAAAADPHRHAPARTPARGYDAPCAEHLG